MEKSNRKAPVVFYVGLMLLCIWFVSFYFMGGLYARYSTSATASDEARTAIFNISAVADSTTEELELDLSFATDVKSGSYGFSVSNDSEVKVDCKVTVTLDNKLPNGVEMRMNLEGTEISLTQVSDTEYTCSATLDFQETHEYTLIFIGDPETVTKNTELSVSIDVTVEQID